MIIIYDQEHTYIEKSLSDAEKIIVDLYGNTIGNEAVEYLKAAPVGASWRKNGGPLVKVVSNTDAKIIEQKEKSIGMI